MWDIADVGTSPASEIGAATRHLVVSGRMYRAL